MAEVFDKATQKVVNVPDASVADQWKAGKVDLLSGARYQVKLKDGTYGTVPSESMADALDAGAQIVSPDEAAKAQRTSATEGFGGAALAGASSALSQFTGGLSDEALLAEARHLEATGERKAGYANAFAQTLSGAREEHPLATMGGEAFGAAGLTAVLPGEGLAGVGERAAARGTEALGLGGEEAGALARTAQRAIVQGVRGTAEATQMAAAQSVSNDAITDHHLTAQQVLSNIGGNALWGGALGAGFGAAGGLFRELRGPAPEVAPTPTETPVVDKALQRGAPSPQDIESVAGKTLGAEPAPGVGQKLADWYTKISAGVSGKDADDISRFVGGPMAEENRAALLEAEQTRDAASRAIRQHIDEMLSSSRDVTDEARGSLKRSYVRRALSDAEAYEVGIDPNAGLTTEQAEARPFDIGREIERDKRGRFQRGTGVRISPSMTEGADIGAGPLTISAPRIDAMSSASRGLADNALSALYDMRDAPDQFGAPTPIAHAIQFAEGVSKKLDAAIDNKDVAEQFSLLDDLKKGIGKYTKGASKLGPASATDELAYQQNLARANKYQQLYESLRRGLEDESVWGKAALDQQQINRAWTQQIEASDRFHRALTTEIGRDPTNPWQTVRGVDPAKADAYVRNLTNPKQDLTHQAVTDYVSSTKNLTDAIREAYELPPDKAAAVDRVANAASAFQQTLDSATKNLTLVNQFERLRQGATMGGAGALGLVAGLESHGIGGGIAGLALGRLAGAFTRPADTIMQLATIEKMARQSDSRIARGLRAFGLGKRVAREAVDASAYARKSSQIARIMSRPETLAQRVGTNLGAVRTFSPPLADAMTATSLTAIQFLHSKLPPMPPGDPFDPKKPAPLPPVSVREQWLRYYQAVEDPLSVVDDLRDGRVSPEGVEVLKTVYPRLFDRVRAQAFDMMASGKLSGLDKQQKIGLSLALDITVPETDPAYIRARQAAYSQPPGGGEPGGGPPRRGKPVNLTKNAPTMSADKVEAGGATGG